MKKEDIEKMKELAAQVEHLKPLVDKYFEASNQLGKLTEKRRLEEIYSRHHRLAIKCNYQPPEYPSMGYVAENGFATFQDENEADDFIRSLREYTSSYYKNFVLKWSGAGDYLVEPTYRIDHDGDTVYVTNFKRIEK